MIHVMLPTQYLHRAGAFHVEPCKRLMAAVLQTVVDDCRGTVYRRARGYRNGLRGVRNATAYMASKDRDWPFSFENLCDALDVDAGGLRKELQREPESHTGVPAGGLDATAATDAASPSTAGGAAMIGTF